MQVRKQIAKPWVTLFFFPFFVYFVFVFIFIFIWKIPRGDSVSRPSIVNHMTWAHTWKVKFAAQWTALSFTELAFGLVHSVIRWCQLPIMFSHELGACFVILQLVVLQKILQSPST